MKKMNLCLLLTVAAILASCSSKNDDDGSASVGGGDVVVTNPSTTRGPNAFKLADNGFQSVGSSLFSSMHFLAATCGAQGEPTSSAVGSAEFAADSVYCAFTVDTGVRGTMRGSYFLASGLMCALEKTTTFTYDSTATIHDAITLSESDSCFGASGFDATNDGDVSDDFTVSVREAQLLEMDYQRLVEIQIGEAVYNPLISDDIELYTLDSGSKVAAKAYQPNAVTEVVVDKDAGTIFLESRDYLTQTHIRTYARGAMEPATGSYTSISEIQGAQSFGDTGAEKHSLIFSADGVSKWVDHHAGTTRAPDYDRCSGDCSVIYIQYDPEFHNFTANPQSNYDNGSIMPTTAPITMSF